MARRHALRRRPDGRLGGTVTCFHTSAPADVSVAANFTRQGLAAAQHFQPVVRTITGGVEYAPRRWRRLHDGRPRFFDRPRELRTVRYDLAARHDQACTDNERKKELQRRNVERQRGDGQKGIAARQPRLSRHRFEEVDDVSMRHLHALGRAGGSRRVDDVREIVRRPHRGFDSIDATFDALRRPDELRQVVDQNRAGFLDEQPRSLHRQAGIEREIRAAGLQDGEQRDDHIDQSLNGQPDDDAGLAAAAAERLRHAVGIGRSIRRS